MKHILTILLITIAVSSQAQTKTAISKQSADSTKIQLSQAYYIAVFDRLDKLKAISQFMKAPYDEVKAIEELMKVTAKKAEELTPKEQPKK